MASSIRIPVLVITPGACGPGLPAAAVQYNTLVATSAAIEGIATITPGVATYTVIAAFDPAYITWFAVAVCTAGVNTFTYVTTGPISVLNSLESQAAAFPTGASVTTTTPGRTSSTTGVATGSRIAPKAPPSKGLAGGPVTGIAIGCFLAGALLTLFAVVCLGRRWQRAHRLQPAAAAAAATEGEVKRKPKRKPVPGPPQDPPMRPVGLDDGPVVGYVGAAVGVGEGEDLPEVRVR
jgi:hypothetical protein